MTVSCYAWGKFIAATLEYMVQQVEDIFKSDSFVWSLAEDGQDEFI